MIKINDVFKIEKEIIEGINPRTKEPFIFERNIFIADDIKFTGNINYVEGILNLDLTNEKYEYVRDYLKGYVSFLEELEVIDEDEKEIERVLAMDDSIIVKTYLIQAMSDVFFTYLSSDMEADEVRKFIYNDIEYEVFKKLCEINE